MSEISKVVVRMYKKLLGDCFLIRIERDDGTKSHVMIDCGLLQGVSGASDYMKKVAADIRETAGGSVDLLVVTHEHWDHISGFSQAKEILLDKDRPLFRQLWMAWTEDPNDKQAEGLRDAFEDRKEAVTHFAVALAASGHDIEGTDGLGGFIGPHDDAAPAAFGSDLGAAPKGRLTGRRVMEELKAQSDEVRYLGPGDVVDVPGTGLPALVLAPPRSESRLFKDLPSKGEGKETYLAESFLAYSMPLDGGAEAAGQTSPFSPRYCGCLKEMESGEKGRDPVRDWFQDHYFAPLDSDGKEQSYRRIDSTWLQPFEALALKLDSDTNNTSLVLAFRLPDDTFMLFAADAQVGNWLSWHDQTYKVNGEELTAEQVLGRTRFYKVGHHGSHNATLRGRGLELMTHKELVAACSTDQTVASKQGKQDKDPPGWEMPYGHVKEALLERTRGRLIRGDRLWKEDPDIDALGRDPDFRDRLDEDNDLYVEYVAYQA
ncbi:MBL fold metallo-hydrolase [Sphingosinicella sp. YJ22]|uniref:MBL fold metallo-hydrolase n=1 Tax=Sphingosinicella sp. YJ22 TaxID=1104780 RepID=UPI00140859E1|nr:MBL fold metallo-hydrolase [Sphingosinicella sp. YJ22]